MNSAFPDKTSNIEVKRTRSGRAVIPPLAGWTGERIVSSLDDAAPLRYVSPTLDARAQYLLSSSMLERFKKQKVIQEPYQMEGKIFHVAPASGHSGRTVPQQKQKNLRTGCRKPVTHRTKKDGRTRTGTQKKMKAVYRMHTRHNDDDESYDRMFDADGVVLQFERYAEAESDSSGSVESRRVSASAFEFAPVYDRKAHHSKKQNLDKNNPRSYEIDTYLLDPEHTRPKKQLEQNVFKDSRTIPRKDHTTRSEKSNVDNVLVIKELQKGEISDFRISKEDVDNYYFTDEDSDTVYTNY